MDLEAEANRIYSTFPRDTRRDNLYSAVMGNEDFPFKDDFYDSDEGRYFALSITESLDNLSLSVIVNYISEKKGYNTEQKNTIYRVFIEEMKKIPGGYRVKSIKTRKTRKARKSRKARKARKSRKY